MSPCFRTVLLVLPLALTACEGTTGLPGTIANPLDAERAAAVQEVNTLRAQAGVSQLAVCASLNTSASGHSDDMRDNNYLAEVSPSTGSDVHSRGCSAGYEAACGGSNIPMAELVAEGFFSGNQTIAQWQMDATSGPILTRPMMLVVGMGRSQGADNVYWTLDLSSSMDPSCN
jgi:uncharacterized protein YkwD